MADAAEDGEPRVQQQIVATGIRRPNVGVGGRDAIVARHRSIDSRCCSHGLAGKGQVKKESAEDLTLKKLRYMSYSSIQNQDQIQKL